MPMRVLRVVFAQNGDQRTLHRRRGTELVELWQRLHQLPMPQQLRSARGGVQQCLCLGEDGSVKSGLKFVLWRAQQQYPIGHEAL